MIRPPRRAVTRFLIPFIDVLILLFCIFLLMPFVSRPGLSGVPELIDAAAATERELALTKHRLTQLKRERANLWERFHVKVLEIDKNNGLLSFLDEQGHRRVIDSQTAVRAMIDSERSRTRGRELCILVVFPKELTGFPLREQITSYRRWLDRIPHVIVNAWGDEP